MKKAVKIIRLFSNAVYWLVVVFLFLIAGGVAVSVVNIPGNYKLYTVQSGSMSPALHTGSVVISKPSDNYIKGDIITFKAETDKNNNNVRSTTTHRIYEVKTKNGEEQYVTKGDANNAPDIEPITRDLVLGKTIFSIPLLGYPISFVKTREGLIILVIIPATIIIYSGVMNIKNEAKRLLEERKKRRLVKNER